MIPFRGILLTSAFGALLACSAPGASAAVNDKITYQGNLRESGVLVNGTKSMVFRLYAASSSPVPIWTSTTYTVAVSTGVFRVVMQPAGVDWEAYSPWLEVEVEGAKLAPREELTAVPYALDALYHSGKRYTSAGAAPASPAAGDLWFDMSANTLKFWNGSTWMPATGAGAVHAFTHAGGGADPLTALGGPALGVAIASSVSAGWLYGNGAGLTGVSAVQVPAAGVLDGTLGMGVRVNAGSLVNGPVNSAILPSTAAFTSIANTFTSSQTITAWDGLSVTYGLIAGSAAVNTGITASSGTFTRTGNTSYSLETSSGILVKAGGVSAPFFSGSGAGLFNLPAANLSGVVPSAALGNAVPKAGGTMTGALVLSADPSAAMEAATKRYVDSWTRPCVNPNDASDVMVPVGDLCVDKYEASVWSAPPTWSAQYGANADNYPCLDNGQDCGASAANPIFARSVSAVTPSRYITWFQASVACSNSGKRLLSNAEWQAAAAGTVDPDANCNVLGGSPTTTGGGGSCLSSCGAENMAGSVSEWVANWIQAGQHYNGPPTNWTQGSFVSAQWPDASYGSDGSWNVAGRADNGGGYRTGLPAALIRGGSYSDLTDAGVFALDAREGPTASRAYVGFRCGRRR
ncbi:MAG: hypothetical protein HY922_14905 [Elusimicrobia bacterium]|nr:hypothetical protein [Elusimicrobiota bacterium]